MKKTMLISLMIICLFIISNVYAQVEEEIISAESELSEGLDLHAVCELFQASQNLEDFERSLNDPDVGINNLDLNDDLDVDYIRVIEEVNGDVRFIVLQVPLGYEDFQDIAVLEVKRTDDGNYEMHVQGDENLYGDNYYLQPSNNNISLWPIINVIFLPDHSLYTSIYYYGYYPPWWKPYRSSKIVVYNRRISKYKASNSFVTVNSKSLKNIDKINRVNSKSNLVKKRSIEKSDSKKIKEERKAINVRKKSRTSTANKKQINKKDKN